MDTTHRPSSTRSTLFWALVSFCAFGLLALLLFRLSGHAENIDRRRATARVEKLKTLQQEDRQKLTRYSWADKAKGTVQLPVARAVELTVADLKNKPVHASGVKVETPYPVGLSQPAPVPVSSAAPAASPANPTAGANNSATAAPAAASPAPSASPKK